ncbi:hypothetical protein K466DRAFT_604795 [Polyporus arcularius HHB13444]|uniref:DUF6534 domain-containing protein n=1 Tax=Polyporus arcularius HHB13444 TaxID=1314778 RepID=A0A5C3NUX0_9APHY|nr:hypothetical protein K466DRAFT_604795 [Polyporus arcularius HHB13444]
MAEVATENPAEAFFGGLLIEVFIACILFGITTLQTFIYFQKYQSDTRSLRLFVAVTWVLEVVHTAFCIQLCYAYVITGFGDFLGFGDINWGVGITVFTEVILSTLVQLFYVRRVWIMSNKNKLLTGGILFFTICRVGFGIGSTILSYHFPHWLLFRAQTAATVTVAGGLGAAALVDVLVALTLSFFLSRGRSEYHKQSNSRVNLIMLYAVNSGAITATASILSVILYATQKESLVFLGLVEIQGKLYANSFLGSLNARSHIRNKVSNNAQYPSFESYSNSGFRPVAPPVPKVEVYRQTVVTNDMGMRVSQQEVDNVSMPSPRSSNYDMKTIKGGELV